MAPRKRRSCAISAGGLTQDKQSENSGQLQVRTNTSIQGRTRRQTSTNVPQPNGDPPTGTKRTFPSSESNISTNQTAAPGPATDNSAKRVRNNGPIHGRPMPFTLVVDGRTAAASPLAPEPVLSSQRSLRREDDFEKFSASYYPGRGQTTHPLDSFPTVNQDFDPTNGGDSGVESEGEWLDDFAGPAEGPTSRISEALANERPSWLGPSSTNGPTTSTALPPADVATLVPLPHINPTLPTPTFSPLVSTNLSMPMPSPLVDITLPTPTPTPSPLVSMTMPAPMHMATTSVPTGANVVPPVWPSETDLVLTPGTSKLMLTLQQPLVQAVIRDSFEFVRAALLLQCALPNVGLSASFVRDALSSGAMLNMPGAASVLRRLQTDTLYRAKIVPLPRARICLFRGLAKEECSALVKTEFLGMDPKSIEDSVDKQLFDYNYIHPIRSTGDDFTVNHSKPYRNDRIVKAICGLYFTGENSFVEQFGERFPLRRNGDGSTSYEVPMPMVALVGTALFAALYDWRSGTHQVTEFSSSMFIDVYHGHIGTLEAIQSKRGNAFHSMMSYIYSEASSSMTSNPSGVQIANIDFDNLDD